MAIGTKDLNVESLDGMDNARLLEADSGRVSARRTRSPTPAVLSSSCAFTRFEVFSTLP